MILFYCPDISEKTGRLSTDESKHCVRVLRHQKGDRIHLIDGKGGIFEAVLISDHPERCTVEIVQKINPGLSAFTGSIHIAIAPTKNISRFEWFLEKSVEIGVGVITPIICQRSERRVLKTNRLEKLIISSMKQAMVPLKPVINEPEPLPVFLDKIKNLEIMKFIGICEDDDRKWLQEVYRKGSDALVLIGPEGDFTTEEIQQARQSGCIPVRISNNRLRTETAGIVACHTLNIINET